MNISPNRRLLAPLLLVLFCGFLLADQSWSRERRGKEHFLQAVEHYNAGRYTIAETLLKKVLKESPQTYDLPTTLLLMKTTRAQGRLDEAKSYGRKLLKSYPNSMYMKDVFFCYGDIFADLGAYDSAFRMYFRARTLARDKTFLQRVDKRLLRAIQLNISLSTLDELLAVETDETAKAILFLARGYRELYLGRPDDSALTLNRIAPEAVPEDYFDLYEKLLLASYRPPKPTVTIGIVAPLSGDFASSGRLFVKGLYQFLQETNSLDLKVAFVIYDNRGEELETIRSVRRLIRNPRVITIIGPLREQTALVAANVVDQYTIPLLLPVAYEDDLTALFKHVFQLNSNLATRGKLAARYAVNILHLDSLAVLAPADKFGESLTDAFLKEADALGSKVVTVEWYTETPKNLSRQFKALRQKAFALREKPNPYEAYLGIVIDSADAMFDVSEIDLFELPEEEPEEKVDSSKIVLETIQGIYLPLHRGDLTYVAPQFPVYNLQTHLLGNGNWQNLEVLNQENVRPHLSGLSLITNYRKPTYDVADPFSDELFTSGYDCARLLLTVMSSTQLTREAVEKQLASVDEFRGVAHIYSFTSSTTPRLNTALQVLNYSAGQFVPVGYFIKDSLRVVQPSTP
ncbi:MAG: ABC transporter substrate-binding protein [Fidelibacterota bacterium]